MGQPVFVSDPIVATHYGSRPGEWVYVADDAEAAWLIANRHAYPLDAPLPAPQAYFLHPEAPAFVPYGKPAPAAARLSRSKA